MPEQEKKKAMVRQAMISLSKKAKEEQVQERREEVLERKRASREAAARWEDELKRKQAKDGALSITTTPLPHIRNTCLISD